MINDSYQKISDDRLMKCIDSSGVISDSFRRLGFVTSDSFFFLCVADLRKEPSAGEERNSYQYVIDLQQKLQDSAELVKKILLEY